MIHRKKTNMTKNKLKTKPSITNSKFQYEFIFIKQFIKTPYTIGIIIPGKIRNILFQKAGISIPTFYNCKYS